MAADDDLMADRLVRIVVVVFFVKAAGVLLLLASATFRATSGRGLPDAVLVPGILRWVIDFGLALVLAAGAGPVRDPLTSGPVGELLQVEGDVPLPHREQVAPERDRTGGRGVSLVGGATQARRPLLLRQVGQEQLAEGQAVGRPPEALGHLLQLPRPRRPRICTTSTSPLLHRAGSALAEARSRSSSSTGVSRSGWTLAAT
jgi:hypothetical protein